MSEKVEIAGKRDSVKEYNKSVYFVLPMVGKTYKELPNLINVYLGDSYHYPEWNFTKIFLHNKIFEDKLLSPNFEKYYQMEDSTYMFVYNIPTQFSQDYDLFCDGKYSQFSERYKQILTSNKKLSDGIMYKILYKTKDRIQYIEDRIGEKLPANAEVASIPDLNREIYNYVLEL